MRTSTGSISVMKITQNAVLRNGKLKYTTANADRIEIRILPMAMPIAMMNEFIIIMLTGSRARRPPENMARV